jgi:fatty acid desaturase
MSKNQGSLAAVGVTFGAVAACLAVAVLSPPIGLAYVLAELALGFAILRTFCLLHDLSHGSLVRGRRSSDVLGHLAALISGVPYHPWKRVHLEHHAWAGWRHRDPTEDDAEFGSLPAVTQAIASWAWRLSVPLLGVSVSIRSFWNLPRLFRAHRDPGDRARFVLSVLLIPAVHGALAAAFGLTYVRAFLPGYAFFLCLLDPIAVSQHSGIPRIAPGSREERPVRSPEQESFARTLVFPRWFARNVLLGFNLHSAHHAQPSLPGQSLVDSDFPASRSEDWWSWLVRAKRRPLAELLDEGGQP